MSPSMPKTPANTELERSRDLISSDPISSDLISSDLTSSNAVDIDVLESVQRRILWLAVRMVDYANRERPNPDAIKVGGHQASSASMVTLMTALWFGHLGPNDYVATKPHASPVLHAINYLLGKLDRRYLTRLREFGGLQAYPSSTKDPYPIDYSTGSVGLGAVAPLFGSAVAQYLTRHFDAPSDRRFIALVGDAELDEGNVWEAIADPITQRLDNVMWVVDLNRQSLDRVVPGIRTTRLRRMFEANGWNVLEAKYGSKLQAIFCEPGGEALREHLDAMSNERYQTIFGAAADEVRARCFDDADVKVKRLVANLDDETLKDTLTNLGGHDIAALDRCYREARRSGAPSVVFAYTVKGWGLPIAGNRMNHSALLTEAQIDLLRSASGLDPEREWDRFANDTAEGRLCRQAADRLQRHPSRAPRKDLDLPIETGATSTGSSSTQEAFGRIVLGLARDPAVMKRLVTTSPDVTVSTNLGGWVNKAGVYSPNDDEPAADDAGLLRWVPRSAGHHLELGISEMNLFMLLGQLGLAGEMFDEPLIPIGTVYDPFVLRGLDAFVYSTYGRSRFIVVGTPSGVSLSYEGGAHQSVVTPSIGIELPGVTYFEPAYAQALDWLFCDAVGRLHDPAGEAAYFRLTTRPVPQAPFADALRRLGRERLREHVLAGGYCLREPQVDGPIVHLAASGPVMAEVLEAAAVIEGEGVGARVLDLTSADRLLRGWRAKLRGCIATARMRSDVGHLGVLIPCAVRNAPIVTVHDAAPHALAWLGSVFGAEVVPLGVETFGQSGSIGDTYVHHQLDVEAIVNAALLALRPAE
jgi:pyruvate dehydrogenase E1 component